VDFLDLLCNTYNVPLVLADDGKVTAIATRLVKRFEPPGRLRAVAEAPVRGLVEKGKANELDALLGGFETDAGRVARELIFVGEQAVDDDGFDRNQMRDLATKLVGEFTKYVQEHPRDIGDPHI
jgi:hypothetical protein